MRELTDKENVSATDEALRYVAKAADGSMRDGLSLLDQCIAFYPKEELTLDKVLVALGAVKTDIYSKVFNDCMSQNVTAVIRDLEEVVTAGTEINRFVADFTWYLRNLMIIKSSDAPEKILDVTSESFAEMKADSEKCELQTIMRFIRILSELTGALKTTTQARVLTEMTLIKLCIPQMDRKPDALMDRIRSIEKKLETGAFVVADSQAGGANTPSAPQEKKIELPAAIPADIQQIADEWSSMADNAEALLKGFMIKVKCSMDVAKPNVLILACPSKMTYEGLKDPERAKVLQGILNERVRKEVVYELVLDENGSKYDTISNSKKPNMEIDESDDDFPKEVF